MSSRSLVPLCPLQRRLKQRNLVCTFLNNPKSSFSDSDLVRTLLDYFNAIPGSQAIQIKTLTDNIAWTKAEKRIFLKHSLETRLVGLCVASFHPSRSTDLQNPNRQLENQQYISALALIDTLLTELKRLDDKMILTEVHLLESRVYRGIGNFAKAKVWRPMHSRYLCSEAFLCVRLPLHLQERRRIRSTVHLVFKPPLTSSPAFFMRKTRITPLLTPTSSKPLKTSPLKVRMAR